MSLISASELLAIQSVAESGMTDSVAIYRRTRAETANGWVDVWPATVSETVLGWLYEITGSGTEIGVIAGAMGENETSWLRLPIGTTISSGDRVVIGGVRFTIEHTNASSTYKPWISCAVQTVT